MDVTRLLENVNAGDKQSRDDLVEAVYEELRSLAAAFFRGERPGHTLQPTALVHEAFLRLITGDVQWQNRAHFFGAASQAMRRILVDHARRKFSQKRGGEAQRVTFQDLDVQTVERGVDVLALDQALTELAAHDARLGKVVEMHCFGGFTFDEIGQMLGIAENTARRDWTYARAWLYDFMGR